MEFAEFIRQFNRMCLYYIRSAGKCTGCPMGGSNISQCRKIAFDNPLTVESIVNEWNQNNPEKYPTWLEWLMSEGVIIRIEESSKEQTRIIPGLCMYSHIPDHIAEMLKLKKR